MTTIKKIIITILTWQARVILRKYKPTIIAITGSVGKTSTKDAIYSVLKSAGGYVRKADKSMNSEIGLPLTIIGIPNAWKSVGGWTSNIIKGLELIISRKEYPDILILEVGADHPGDISSVARWLRPHIAVITRISMTPVHVEFFHSPEEVFEEKASLAESVRPGGTLILLADDAKLLTIAERVKDRNVKVVSFGTSLSADVRGLEQMTLYGNNAPTGISFKIESEGMAGFISAQGIVGNTHIYSLLAAAAVGKVRCMTTEKIVQSLSEYAAPPGRMNVLPGINGSTIIDDTYNSSPDAVQSALETVRGLESKGVRIAVLADMMELGKYSGDEHRKAGALAAQSVKQLITVGPRSRSWTAVGALEAGMFTGAVHSFATPAEAAPRLTALIRPGDIILVKGSQSMRMERLVKALLREPEKAGKLLVRQEKEWLEKE